MLQADRGGWLQGRLRRRPGALGLPLLLATYVLLGMALVGYVVAMLVLAFAAVAVHTVRLLAGPPVAALLRAGRTHTAA